MKTTGGHTLASPTGSSAVAGAAEAALSFVKGAFNDQALRWPLLFPFALVAGAAIYMTSPDEPGWFLLALATAPPALAWALLRRGGSILALGCGLLACAGIGAIAGKVRAELMAAPILHEEIGPVRIEGVIAEIDASERSRRIRIAPRAIEDLTPEDTPKYVRFSYKGEIQFSPGRAIACSAILSPPPRPVVPGDYTFHRDAWFQQLGGVGFSTGRCEPLPTLPPSTLPQSIGYWIGALRRALATHVYEAAGAAGGGMSAAMVAGDRSFISPDDSEALRLSGLAHLLSISGVHMVLAGGIVFFAIRFLWPFFEPLALRVPSVRAAAFGAIVACTLYFAVSGAEVATQRAYIMALIGFGAKLFDRPALSLRSVAVALFVVVLFQPESVVTPGFQMSFAASGALIALYEIWPKLDRPIRPGLFGRVRAWIIGTAATSLVASVATMPFALYHFDRAALFSVVANIVSTPVITLWTTPAAAAAAIAAPFGLDEPFLALMGKSLEVVLAIARWSVDTSPDFDLPRLGAAGLAWFAFAIGLFCVASGRGRIFAAGPLAIAMTVWFTGPQPAAYVAADGAVFVETNTGWVELTDWRTENGLNPLIIGDGIGKSPCPGKAASCTIEARTGRFAIVPTDQAQPSPCPAQAELVFTPAGASPPLSIQPCTYIGRGGAVIELAGATPQIHTAQKQSGRAWTQPLYEKPAKIPRQDSAARR